MFDCETVSWIGNEAFLRDFNRRASRQRIPLMGNLDLTHRCNLRCRHCYLDEASRAAREPGSELDTAAWLNVIDQVVDAGCLYMLLTGGEPLLRPDFARIYRYTKEKGCLVTVFTNGTRVDEPLLDLFSSLPPRHVEISLYGATPAVHDAITGVAGSQRRSLAAIDRLLERGIQVRLKTILMRDNLHEFYDLEAMARERGVAFRFDAAIFPRLSGDPAPLAQRVGVEEVVEREFADEIRREEWRRFYDRFAGTPAADKLFVCGAGRTHFHVDPVGRLQPCLMVTSIAGDLKESDFSTEWRCLGDRLEARKMPADSPCRACDRKSLCGYCPGFFELETGQNHQPVDFLCRLGHTRYEKIQEMI